MKVFFERLFSLLNEHDKRFLYLLVAVSVFVSFIETFGVAAIMPFISVAMDFSLIDSNRYYHYAYTLLGFTTPVSFVIAFGLLLIGFYLVRSGINLTYFFLLAKFSKGRYHKLAYRLFENFIRRSYRDFLTMNSSLMSKAIVSEAFYLTNILSALLLMMSESFIVILIYSMMVYVNWKVTLALTVLLLLNGFFLVKKVSPKIKKAGRDREHYQRIFYEIMNATFGNFKMFKLKADDTQVLENFRRASGGFAQASIVNETLVHFPRLFLEALAFSIVISVVIYFIYVRQSDASAVMALVSMFVLGLYRLMPSVTRILSSYNTVLYHLRSLELIYENLSVSAEEVGTEPLQFEQTIVLENVSFAYTELHPVLQQVSLQIKKGEKVAFIGESGSGKSTLADLVMGLYPPQNGTIMVDNVVLDSANVGSWRKKIGYIPQQIYLFDGTIAENVAFDSVVDREKVQKVLEAANLLDFLQVHHEGIDTEVGENGLKLSGGQKQRVAIARALYTDPEILILDEATSALDTETERRIMEEIYRISVSKTLIVIAHNLNTIVGCDTIYRLQEGAVQHVRLFGEFERTNQ